MKSTLVILTIFFLSITSMFAQPGQVPVKEKDGKQYYIHTVSKGQTAYGISKMYDTSVNEIFEANKKAEKGLKIGQELWIPKKGSETSNNTDVNHTEDPVITEPIEGFQEEVTQKDTSKLIHTVTAGETMYALSKKYGVSLEDLMEANKGKVSLSVGDEIIIPVDKADQSNEVTPIVKDPINNSVNPGDSVILHKVEAGETFYSITKEYGVTEKSIRDANNGLQSGLIKGAIIKIIVKKKIQPTTWTDTAVAIVYDSTTRIEEVYDVAIMLPYMLDENDKFRAKCPPVGDCPIYGYTMMSMNFQRGIMMAVDSLRKAGLNVNLHVYDTDNDTATISKILAKSEMDGMDLIFGPLYPRQIKMVAEFAKEKHIQNIIPVPVSNKALYHNPYLSKYVTSKATQVQLLGKYVADSLGHTNVIAIKNKGDEQDGYYFDEFVASYNEQVIKNPKRLADSVKHTTMSTSSKLSAVEAKLSATALNVLVVPSQDLGHVSNFVTKLVATSNRNPYSKYEYMIIGLEDWVDFETIDEKYKNRFNLTVCTAGFIDYNDQAVKDFIKEFRIVYGTDPDKYAINGFDAAFTNLSGLLQFGTAYAQNYNYLKTKGFASDSDYKMVEQGSGFENQAVYFLRYNDYKVEVINK